MMPVFEAEQAQRLGDTEKVSVCAKQRSVRQSMHQIHLLGIMRLRYLLGIVWLGRCDSPDVTQLNLQDVTSSPQLELISWPAMLGRSQALSCPAAAASPPLICPDPVVLHTVLIQTDDTREARRVIPTANKPRPRTNVGVMGFSGRLSGAVSAAGCRAHVEDELGVAGVEVGPVLERPVRAAGDLLQLPHVALAAQVHRHVVPARVRPVAQAQNCNTHVACHTSG